MRNLEASNSETLQKYQRASDVSAPKLASRVAGLSLNGYWLDSRSYFFVAEHLCSDTGEIVKTPCVAIADADEIKTVIPADKIIQHWLAHHPQPVASEFRAFARYDMPAADKLAVEFEGRVIVIDLNTNRVVHSGVNNKEPLLVSPDGKKAVFIKDNDIWLRDLQSSADTPLSTDGAQHVSYGRMSEACLNAISYRKNPWPVGVWSHDSRFFLTYKIDERAVPEIGIVEHAPANGARPNTHSFKYPMPGDPLPIATYVAYECETGKSTLFDQHPVPLIAPFTPFTWTAWFSCPGTGWVVRFDRNFRRAELIRLNMQDGTNEIVLSEEAVDGFLSMHSFPSNQLNVRVLDASNEIIWFSERAGWGHLYLYDGQTGLLKRQITRDAWRVREIIHLDVERRKVFFLAGGLNAATDPARRSLCSASLDRDELNVLIDAEGDVFVAATASGGMNQDRLFRDSYRNPGVSPDGKYAVARIGHVSAGNETAIFDLGGSKKVALSRVLPKEGGAQVQTIKAKAADGTTILYGTLFLPPNFDQTQQYPLIDYIYPGPQVAWQPQAYGTICAAQALSLAELGFAVLMLDSRGNGTRSREFHQIGYGKIYEPQVSDHASAIQQLIGEYPFLDGSRVGITGASGGGGAVVRAMCVYPEIFKVGVSVCGNHNSTNYEAQWAEQYRGPFNEKLYRADDNNSVAAGLQGKLLLISGDLDQNVLVSQTLSLVDALISADRNVDLLIVPNYGHSVGIESGYAQRRLWDYFVLHLQGHEPPEFSLRYAKREIARAYEIPFQ